MTDLTEKLKELLMATGHFNGYGSDFIAEKIAQQLAPEIEKMMPRWIPVSERLPDRGQEVDIITVHDGKARDVETIIRSDGGVQFEDDERTFYACQVTHWTPIMKGPMG